MKLTIKLALMLALLLNLRGKERFVDYSLAENFLRISLGPLRDKCKLYLATFQTYEFRLMNWFFLESLQIKHNVVKMARRDPCLLQGALLVLTLITAVTAGL